MKACEQLKSYKLSQVISILKSHEDKVIEGSKSIVDASLLSLVVKEEISKVKKSKEKVVVDYEYDSTYDEWTSEKEGVNGEKS